jgi:hypothetical protein
VELEGKKFLVIKEKIQCDMCHKKPPPPTSTQNEKELPQIQCPRQKKLMTFSLSLPVSQSTPTQFPKTNASSGSNWRIGFQNKLQS